MDLEVPPPVDPTTGGNNADAEPSFTSSPASKKSRGKVPKRVHKAERERLKRENLNELFLELAEALELSEQNSGKASILCETTRSVKDMLAQIECLKRENTTLLFESQYVAVEKNELEDENSALQNQIRDLNSTLMERTVQPNLDLNITPPDYQEPQVTSYFPESCPKFPVSDPEHPAHANKPMSKVTKPHPRYPTPSDSWPYQILEKQSEVGKELQYSGKERIFGTTV